MKQSSPPPPSAGHVCVRGVSGPFPLRLRHFVLLRPSTSVIAPADCFPCYAHASHVGDRGEADQVSMFCFVSETPDACTESPSAVWYPPAGAVHHMLGRERMFEVLPMVHLGKRVSGGPLFRRSTARLRSREVCARVSAFVGRATEWAAPTPVGSERPRCRDFCVVCVFPSLLLENVESM